MSNNPKIPASGHLDIHSHLLPGLDDGCRTIDDSLTCVAQLKKNGFAGTICTPHLWPEAYPENTPARVEREVVRLRERFVEAEVDYPIWAGGELRIAEDSITWLEEVGVPTLGPSRCVLMDYWGEQWPDYADRLMRYLIDRGYQPILAHPERLNFDRPTMEKLIASMAEMGVPLQGNFNCMTGLEGSNAAYWVRRLLREGRYAVMAMDMHRPDSLPGRFEGLRLVGLEAGEPARKELTEDAPRAILAGQWNQSPASSGEA